MNRTTPFSFLLVSLLVGFNLACAKKSTTPAASSTTGGGTTGGGNTGGSLFAASDIVKSWSSSCIADTDPVTGATYYNILFNLNSDGSFSYQNIWYFSPTGMEGNCSPADYAVVYSSGGSFTVGGLVSGSTTTQSLSFTTTSSSMEVLATGSENTSLQNIFNNDCGGTSPYCTLSNGSCINNGIAAGTYESSQHMLCQHYTFPNTVNSSVLNIATFSGGILTIGAPALGIPGVFSAGNLATTATVAFH